MVLLWLTRRPLPLCAVGKGGRQKAQDKAQALTTAPVTGRLLRHLPYTLASLLFSAFYNVADTLFVSHGVGDLAAAGISVVFPLTVLQGAIAQMVGAGAGALVSPCLGQKDYRAAGRVTKSAMAFFYTTALGITCVCLLFRTPLLRLFGATAEILPYARTYFTILAAGNVFSTGFSSIIRAEGRMDYSLWIWLLPTGVNLLLDWLLIYRLHLGIAGAAWATVIAQAASFCMSVLFFTRFSCQQFRGVRADRATVGRILTLGLPTLVQMGSLSVVLVVMNGLLAPRAGTVGVAAFGYVSRLAEFALAPFSALCLAAAPIIGSSYGAGLHSRVRQTVVRTVQLGLVYAVVAVAVCYTLSGAAAGYFYSRSGDRAIWCLLLAAVGTGSVVLAAGTDGECLFPVGKPSQIGAGYRRCAAVVPVRGCVPGGTPGHRGCLVGRAHCCRRLRRILRGALYSAGREKEASGFVGGVMLFVILVRAADCRPYLFIGTSKTKKRAPCNKGRQRV